MQLYVTSTNLELNQHLRTELSQRVKSVFGRSKQYIDRVWVTLTDINGPRGGNDKECKVKLSLPGLPSVLVMSRKDSIPKAIATALNTASLTLKRKVKRHKSLQRQTRFSAVTLQDETA
jgi:putative sigma-54 modulation protein